MSVVEVDFAARRRITIPQGPGRKKKCLECNIELRICFRKEHTGTTIDRGFICPRCLTFTPGSKP